MLILLRRVLVITHSIKLFAQLLNMLIFQSEDLIRAHFRFGTQARIPSPLVQLVLEVIYLFTLQIVSIVVLESKCIALADEVVGIETRLTFIDTQKVKQALPLALVILRSYICVKRRIGKPGSCSDLVGDDFV